MSSVGFLVWNPAGRLPTRVHPTFLSAVAEASRLKRLHPHQRFYVMAPVEDQSMIGHALGWERGRADGLAQAHREIMVAEARADRFCEELFELKRRRPGMDAIAREARRFQTVVADVLCWFAGYEAAHSPKKRRRIWLPEREMLRDLNRHLLDALEADEPRRPADDQEIPF